MKRLIDEEDAIRAICKNCYAEDVGDYKDCRYYPCDDVQAIEALPSTDVERIKDIMKKANEQDNHIGRPTDIISRADAIEAVVAWTVEDRPSEEMPTDLVDRLKALPSADITETEECQKCQETTERVLLNKASAEAVQGEWKRVPTRTYKGR